MNIIFFGNGDFGIPSFKEIYNSEYKLLCLVTNKIKRKGRNKKYIFSNIYNEAKLINVNIIEQDNLKDPLFLDEWPTLLKWFLFDLGLNLLIFPFLIF